MRIKLIACINHVNALGKDNSLLYHISSDLANFKRLTIGGVLIMGKNTYESLPKKPLPNRTTIIICNEENYNPQNNGDNAVFVADSIPSALSIAETLDNENVFVVGGASIYTQFIESGLVDEMYLTIVDDETEGDVVFPEISSTQYQLRYISEPMKDGKGKDALKYSFAIYQKI